MEDIQKTSFTFRTRTRVINCVQPLVMGILNCTPDSFSDGGCYLDKDAALTCATRMIEEGADIIDVGGESSRPGAAPVSEQEELDRVLPVLETLRQRFDVLLSIDTVKPAVAEAALSLEVDILNDITGGRDQQMFEIVAKHQAAMVIMHMRGNPKTMMKSTDYEDVTEEILKFFRDQLAIAQVCGLKSDALILDPGVGFAKTTPQNFSVLKNLPTLLSLKRPLLVGASRKTLIGETLDELPENRLEGSLAIAATAVTNGAAILRVHDVAETVKAIKVATRVRDGK